eukprot:8237633-Alexandrium_andersonii.AAC.1
MSVRVVARAQVCEVVAPARRAPLACPRAWVRLNALLGEVPQPAAPRVLSEGRMLVSAEPGLSKAVPFVSVGGALVQPQEPED